MKGGEHGKARGQDRSGDGRGIGDRRGDGQAFSRRGRERGILRSGRRARPARGGRARDRRRQGSPWKVKPDRDRIAEEAVGQKHGSAPAYAAKNAEISQQEAAWQLALSSG